MQQRRIVGTSTVGSISRHQARRAAKTVKLAKSTAKAARKTTSSRNGQFVSASILERYLGHFGSSPTPRRNAADVKKRSARKTAAKKLPAK